MSAVRDGFCGTRAACWKPGTISIETSRCGDAQRNRLATPVAPPISRSGFIYHSMGSRTLERGPRGYLYKRYVMTVPLESPGPAEIRSVRG